MEAAGFGVWIGIRATDPTQGGSRCVTGFLLPTPPPPLLELFGCPTALGVVFLRGKCLLQVDQQSLVSF